MLLSGDASCAGQFMRVVGGVAPLCIGCLRFGHRSPNQIAPEAAMVAPGGEWACVNRRSGGHVETLPVDSSAAHPLDGSAVRTSGNTAPEVGKP